MNFQWLFNRPIAHRGLHNEQFPENSMPAYRNAIEHNFNIEIDVHVSKDGHVVVFHDNNLKRVCGVDKLVKDCTLDELKSYRLLGSECTIPTLKEFLDLVDGQVGILCEIKGLNPLNHRIVRNTLKEIKDYKGNIALQSFDFGAVRYAKRHCDLPVGELCTWSSLDGKQARCRATDFMGKLWICALSHPHFISYDVRALNDEDGENKYVKKYAKKVPVITWTVRTQKEIEDAQKYASIMIFENLSLDDANNAVGHFAPYQCPQNRRPDAND